MPASRRRFCDSRLNSKETHVPATRLHVWSLLPRARTNTAKLTWVPRAFAVAASILDVGTAGLCHDYREKEVDEVLYVLCCRKHKTRIDAWLSVSRQTPLEAAEGDPDELEHAKDAEVRRDVLLAHRSFPVLFTCWRWSMVLPPLLPDRANKRAAREKFLSDARRGRQRRSKHAIARAILNSAVLGIAVVDLLDVLDGADFFCTESLKQLPYRENKLQYIIREAVTEKNGLRGWVKELGLRAARTSSGHVQPARKANSVLEPPVVGFVVPNMLRGQMLAYQTDSWGLLRQLSLLGVASSDAVPRLRRPHLPLPPRERPVQFHKPQPRTSTKKRRAALHRAHLIYMARAKAALARLPTALDAVWLALFGAPPGQGTGGPRSVLPSDLDDLGSGDLIRLLHVHHMQQNYSSETATNVFAAQGERLHVAAASLAELNVRHGRQVHDEVLAFISGAPSDSTLRRRTLDAWNESADMHTSDLRAFLAERYAASCGDEDGHAHELQHEHAERAEFEVGTLVVLLSMDNVNSPSFNGIVTTVIDAANGRKLVLRHRRHDGDGRGDGVRQPPRRRQRRHADHDHGHDRQDQQQRQSPAMAAPPALHRLFHDCPKAASQSAQLPGGDGSVLNALLDGDEHVFTDSTEESYSRLVSIGGMANRVKIDSAVRALQGGDGGAGRRADDGADAGDDDADAMFAFDVTRAAELERGALGVPNVHAGMMRYFSKYDKSGEMVLPDNGAFPIAITEGNSGKRDDVKQHLDAAIEAVTGAVGHDNFTLMFEVDLQLFDILQDLRHAHDEYRERVHVQLGYAHLMWNYSSLLCKHYERGFIVELARSMDISTKTLLHSSRNRDQMDVLTAAFQLFLSATVRRFVSQDPNGQQLELGELADLEPLLQDDSFGERYMRWGRRQADLDDTFAIVWQFLWQHVAPLLDLRLAVRCGVHALRWSALSRMANVYLPSSHTRYAKAVHAQLVHYLVASPLGSFRAPDDVSSSFSHRAILDWCAARSATGLPFTAQSIDELQELAVVKTLKQAMRECLPRDKARRLAFLRYALKERGAAFSSTGASGAAERVASRFSPVRLGHAAARHLGRAALIRLDLDVGGGGGGARAAAAHPWPDRDQLQAVNADGDGAQGHGVDEGVLVAGRVRDAILNLLERVDRMVTCQQRAPRVPVDGDGDLDVGADADGDGPDGTQHVRAFYSLSKAVSTEITEEEVYDMRSYSQLALEVSPKQAQLCVADVLSVERGERVRRKQTKRLLRRLSTFQSSTARRGGAAAPRENPSRLHYVMDKFGSLFADISDAGGTWPDDVPMPTKNFSAWCETWFSEATAELAPLGLSVKDVAQDAIMPMMVLPTRFCTIYGTTFDVRKSKTLESWLDSLGCEFLPKYDVPIALQQPQGDVVVLVDAISALYTTVPEEVTWSTLFDHLLKSMLRMTQQVCEEVSPRFIGLFLDDERFVPVIKAWLNRGADSPVKIDGDLISFDLNDTAIAAGQHKVWAALLADKKLRHRLLRALVNYAKTRLSDPELWSSATVKMPSDCFIYVECEHETPVCVRLDGANSRDVSSSVRSAVRQLHHVHERSMSAQTGEGEAKVLYALRATLARHVLGLNTNATETVVVSNDSDMAALTLLNSAARTMLRPGTRCFLDLGEARQKITELPGLQAIDDAATRVRVAVLLLRSFGSDYMPRTRAFGSREKEVFAALGSGALLRCLCALLGEAWWHSPLFMSQAGKPTRRLCQALLYVEAAIACPLANWATWPLHSERGTMPAAQHMPRPAPLDALVSWFSQQMAIATEQFPARDDGDGAEGQARVLDARLHMTEVAVVLAYAEAAGVRHRATVPPLPGMMARVADRLVLDFVTLVDTSLGDLRLEMWTTALRAKAGDFSPCAYGALLDGARDGETVKIVPVWNSGLACRVLKGVFRLELTVKRQGPRRVAGFTSMPKALSAGDVQRQRRKRRRRQRVRHERLVVGAVRAQAGGGGNVRRQPPRQRQAAARQQRAARRAQRQLQQQREASTTSTAQQAARAAAAVHVQPDRVLRRRGAKRSTQEALSDASEDEDDDDGDVAMSDAEPAVDECDDGEDAAGDDDASVEALEDVVPDEDKEYVLGGDDYDDGGDDDDDCVR